MKALSQPDITVSSRAAAVVTCMLDDNPAVKQRLLSIPLELSPAPGAPPTLLMPQCISHLSNAIYSPGERLKGLCQGTPCCSPSVKLLAPPESCLMAPVA